MGDLLRGVRGTLKQKNSCPKSLWGTICLWILMAICSWAVYMAILQSLFVIERAHSNLFGSSSWLVTLILVVIFWGISLCRWIGWQKDEYHLTFREGLREIVWNISALVPVVLALTAGMETVGWITILRPNLYAGIRAMCALESSVMLHVMLFRAVRKDVPIGNNKE